MFLFCGGEGGGVHYIDREKTKMSYWKKKANSFWRYKITFIFKARKIRNKVKCNLLLGQNQQGYLKLL